MLVLRYVCGFVVCCCVVGVVCRLWFVVICLFCAAVSCLLCVVCISSLWFVVGCVLFLVGVVGFVVLVTVRCFVLFVGS